MTTDKKVARRKLSLLDLASELNNVSKACKSSSEEQMIQRIICHEERLLAPAVLRDLAQLPGLWS